MDRRQLGHGGNAHGSQRLGTLAMRILGQPLRGSLRVAVVRIVVVHVGRLAAKRGRLAYAGVVGTRTLKAAGPNRRRRSHWSPGEEARKHEKRPKPNNAGQQFDRLHVFPIGFPCKYYAILALLTYPCIWRGLATWRRFAIRRAPRT